MTALVLAHFGVGLWIVEVGVRVEHPEHAWDGTVIDRRVSFVAVDGLSVVLLDEGVDIGKALQAVADLALVLGRLGADFALHDAADKGTDGEEEGKSEKCPAGAWGHRREVPPDSRAAGASQGRARQS